MFISFNNSWMNESSDQSLCECIIRKADGEARCTAGVVDIILLLLICHFNARHVFEKEMTHAGGSSCCTSAFPKLFVKMGHLRPCAHSLCILLRWGHWPPCCSWNRCRFVDLLRLFWVSREVPTVCYQGASKETAHAFSKVQLNDGWAAASWIAKAKQVQKASKSSESLPWIHLKSPKSHFTFRIISCVVLWHYDLFSIVLKAFNVNCF